MELNNSSRSLTNSNLYDGEYFDVISNEGDILIVRCNICTPDGPDGQLLRTSVKSNGNILKHAKRRHPEMLEKIKSEKSVKSRAARVLKRENEDMKPYLKKKVVQVKIKKQDEDMNDCETTQVFLNEDHDSYNANEMYVIEPCESTESDGEDYVEFELENSRADDRSIESVDDHVNVLNTDYEYVRSSTVKRPRISNTYEGSPPYKRAHTEQNNSLIEFQKKLMQMEFDDNKKLRHEKHQLEIAILKAELTHKTLEHQKQMELMNKKIHD